MPKKFMTFLVLAVIALGLPLGYKWMTYGWTSGFKLTKLQLSLPHSSQWEVEPLLTEENLEEIFSQPFLFLGKGVQSYVYQSQDEKYVLKLLRFDRRNSRFFDRGTWGLAHQKRAVRLFSSCLLAWERAREETALLHLHLNQTASSLPILKVKAPSGRTLHLALDKTRFVLQRRATPIRQALDEALIDGSLSTKLASLTQLLEQRAAQGIGNRDSNLWRNFGFLGNQAVEIDFGGYEERLDFSSERARREEVERYLSCVRDWMEKKSR